MNTDLFSTNERRYRRQDWTAGAVVTLAGGSAWHYPTIDVALLTANASLRDDFVQAVLISGMAPPEGESVNGQILLTTLYHAHLANVAVRLLRINYDLPDRRLAALVRFETLADLLGMTAGTSQVVADAFDSGSRPMEAWAHGGVVVGSIN